MTSNESYIGKNIGQIKDMNNMDESNESNIITNNIKLYNNNNTNNQNSETKNTTDKTETETENETENDNNKL